MIFPTASGASNDPVIIYNFNPGKVELFTGSGRTGVMGVAADTWHHVVAAFYGNSGGFGDNLREIYIDGVLTQSTADTFSFGHGLSQIAIGNAINGTVPVSGAIDDYAIYELGNLIDLEARWTRVAEIAEHYNLSDDPAGFRITDIALLPSRKISLTWILKPDTVYTISWSSDLVVFGGDVGDDIDAQGISTSHIFDNPSVDFANPDGLPELFFRISEN